MSEIEGALGRATLFIVGTIRELQADERASLAAIGDPAKPFFVDATRFPRMAPWPASLQTRYNERAEPLTDLVDGVVYLGPEPDTILVGAIPLSAEQTRELARRGAITSDPQRTMRARYQGRGEWFRAHPNDVPPRP